MNDCWFYFAAGIFHGWLVEVILSHLKVGERFIAFMRRRRAQRQWRNYD